MTKSGLSPNLTLATKNAHCTNRAQVLYKGFSQIQSHVVDLDGRPIRIFASDDVIFERAKTKLLHSNLHSMIDFQLNNGK